MKLRNKKTGKVVEWFNNTDGIFPNSLAELNEEWEDYEEQKGNWTIDPMNIDYIDDGKYAAPDELERCEELGLKFNTKEEAEEAVEKLKAWKRLKEAGFEFGGWSHTPITQSLTCYNLHIKAYSDKLADYMDDLQLLFGGGDE